MPTALRLRPRGSNRNPYWAAQFRLKKFTERMITRDTNLKGAFVIEPERFEDARGFFARVVRRRVHGDRRRGPIHRSQLLVQSQTRDPTRTALAGRAACQAKLVDVLAVRSSMWELT